MYGCRYAGLFLLCLLSAIPGSEAEAQKAAYVVQSKVDVDGDGRVDELRIDDLGTITVAIAGKPDAGAWTALAATGKVVGGELQVKRNMGVPGGAIIVATSKLRIRRSRTHEEAVVLAWEPGKLTALWRGATGVVGRDGAQHVSIELGKYGLIKYASRQGVYRCDGETAHLDAQRFDFKKGKFRDVRQAVRVDSGPQVSTLHTKAQPDDPKLVGVQGFWFRPQGASSSTQARSAAELVAPTAISDGNEKTAWVESKGGFGRGEFVTLKSSVGTVRIKALRLLLGHGGAAGEFNRPKRIALLLGKTHKFWIEVDKDPKGVQWVQLPEAVPSDCVTLVLDDVYPRNASRANTGRTAISEISVVSEEDLDPAIAGALLATRIAAGKGGADLRRLLKAWGVKAAPSLVDAIAGAKDERSRMRLRLALARIPAAADELVAGLSSESLRSAELAQLRRGIETLGTEAIGALADALDDALLSPEAAQLVATLLAAIPGIEASEALLQAVGKGTRARRRALMRALGKRPLIARALTDAIDSSEAGPRQGDLYKALGHAGAAMPADSPHRGELAQKVAGALAHPDLPYEVRYRLLQAASLIGGEPLRAALLSEVKARVDAQDPESTALSRVAVAALAEVNTAPDSAAAREVEDALQKALEHKDPGVRLAVVGRLGNSIRMLPGLATRLRDDHWPEVRRAVAASLALHCQSEAAGAALAEATREDHDEQVAMTALSALLRCNPPHLFALLLEMVDDKKRPMGVRLYAARHLGITPNHSATEVIKRFRKSRGLALTDRAHGKIASALTVALTDLASAEALRHLEDSAADPAVPELQAAAVTGLGKLCRPSSKSIIRSLKGSPTTSVAMAARQAAGRCK